MPNLADVLKTFDRKERNWLLRDALGNPPLSAKFRERLQDALAPSVAGIVIPPDAFWAMDFHWNWLVAALAELEGPGRTHAADGAVVPNQEDIDLLVAFGNTAVLVEAKATGSWSNKQIASKLSRLGHLRKAADSHQNRFGVALHFVLTSPTPPRGLLKSHVWHTPDGQFIWMPMHAPGADDFLRVSFSGKGDAARGREPFWAVSTARNPQTRKW